jgi:competence protein ComEA
MKRKKQIMVWVMAVSMVLLMTAVGSAQPAGKININKASVEELTQLKNVGDKFAQRIVEYREKNGPFKTPADIMKVKGIGSKIWELNKDRIVIK